MCDICGDRGIVQVEGTTFKICDCMIKRKILNKFKDSKLSKQMLSSSFANFNYDYYKKNIVYIKKAVQLAQDFANSVVNGQATDGLMLTGRAGHGKTYLACCIANVLIRKNIATLFTVVPNLLDQIKSTYNKGEGQPEYNEKDLLDTAREVQVLILDDLGAHQYTEWAQGKLFTILNHRINFNLPTVITTNLDLKDMDKTIGERAASRIIQLCQPIKIEADDDIRMQKRLAKWNDAT